MVVGWVHLWGSLGVQACWQGVSREKSGCRLLHLVVLAISVAKV